VLPYTHQWLCRWCHLRSLAVKGIPLQSEDPQEFSQHLIPYPIHLHLECSTARRSLRSPQITENAPIENNIAALIQLLLEQCHAQLQRRYGRSLVDVLNLSGRPAVLVVLTADGGQQPAVLLRQSLFVCLCETAQLLVDLVHAVLAVIGLVAAVLVVRGHLACNGQRSADGGQRTEHSG
jgi:hypothetical protein